jgi:hypothetical protein
MDGDHKLIKAAFDLFISALKATGGALFEKVTTIFNHACLFLVAQVILCMISMPGENTLAE